MIVGIPYGHHLLMMGQAAVLPTHDLESYDERRVDASVIRALVREHHRFIWRLLSRLGVPESDVDDATQQVFMVLTQRQELVLKVGSEKSFLFGVALKVARTHKRTLARRRENGQETMDETSASQPSAEALTDQRRARQLLDSILEAMPEDLRVVFVLFELDDMQSTEIATLLGIPVGTVASRLRRAREWFQRRLAQLQAQMRGKGALV